MKMHKTLLLSLLILQFMGCSTTRIITTPDKLNKAVADEEVTLLFESGFMCDATNVVATDDSTQFIVTETGKSMQVATPDIKAVRIFHHTMGAISGFFSGVAIGSTVMGILVSVNSDDSSGGHAVQSAFIAGGVVLGGAIGGTIAGIKGTETYYVIVKDSANAAIRSNP